MIRGVEPTSGDRDQGGRDQQLPRGREGEGGGGEGGLGEEAELRANGPSGSWNWLQGFLFCFPIFDSKVFWEE